MFGSSEHGTTDRILNNTERLMNKKHEEEGYGNVLHTPGGMHVHQGSLIRGDGMTEPQGAMNEQGFRRFTVQKLGNLQKKDVNFMIERGQHAQFMNMGCLSAIQSGLQR